MLDANDFGRAASVLSLAGETLQRTNVRYRKSQIAAIADKTQPRYVIFAIDAPSRSVTWRWLNDSLPLIVTDGLDCHPTATRGFTDRKHVKRFRLIL
jgi:hypothetical protein